MNTAAISQGHSAPTPTELTMVIIELFSAYARAFSSTWHHRWSDLACERASVAKVAEELMRKFPGHIDAWCEVKSAYAYERLGKSTVSNSTIDLILIEPRSSAIMALIEFKTHSGVFADVAKLEAMQNDLHVRIAMCVGCQNVRLDTRDRGRSNDQLRQWLNKSKADVEVKRWNFEEGLPVVIGDGRDAHLVGTFAAWRTKDAISC